MNKNGLLDDRGECRADHDRDRQVDDVAPHQELVEAGETGTDQFGRRFHDATTAGFFSSRAPDSPRGRRAPQAAPSPVMSSAERLCDCGG